MLSSLSYAAAGALPAMDRAIQATIEYTSQRQAFGKSILDNQYVHYRLAELQTEVECLRALLNQVSFNFSKVSSDYKSDNSFKN